MRVGGNQVLIGGAVVGRGINTVGNRLTVNKHVFSLCGKGHRAGGVAIGTVTFCPSLIVAGPVKTTLVVSTVSLTATSCVSVVIKFS